MFRAIPHYLNFAIISRLSTSSNRKKILVENGQVLSQHKNKIIGLQQYKISSTFKNGIYSSWTLTKRVPMLLQSIHSFNRKRKSRTSLIFCTTSHCLKVCHSFKNHRKYQSMIEGDLNQKTYRSKS